MTAPLGIYSVSYDRLKPKFSVDLPRNACVSWEKHAVAPKHTTNKYDNAKHELPGEIGDTLAHPDPWIDSNSCPSKAGSKH